MQSIFDVIELPHWALYTAIALMVVGILGMSFYLVQMFRYRDNDAAVSKLSIKFVIAFLATLIILVILQGLRWLQ